MHAMSRRLALLALGALTLFGTTACGDDDDPVQPQSVTGTYTLATVNGQPLPETLYEGNDLGTYYKVEVIGGRITLDADGTFDDVTNIRETEGTSAPNTSTLAVSGTYTRSGNRLTLFDPDSGEEYMLTIQNDGSLVQAGEFGGFQITGRYVKQ